MNILTGCELVRRGTSKTDAALPVLDVKEVTANGTSCEENQIRAAVEARKEMLGVERIEKCGAMSHAIWNDVTMLAEVTRKVGGHWLYLGHNVGKQLYLKGEEALFMLELNALFLKYHDVQVSLQQAYTLLLGSQSQSISQLQYKVFASLSRLGYRLYRHEAPDEITSPDTSNANKEGNCTITESTSTSGIGSSNQINIKVEKIDFESVKIKQEPVEEEYTGELNYDIPNIPIKIENIKSEPGVSASSSKQDDAQKNICCQMKLKNLKSRKLKPCNPKVLQKYFNNLPELLGTSTVIVKKPDNMYIPINVVVKRAEYTVNLVNIRQKGVRTDALETYDEDDEVNMSNRPGNNDGLMRNMAFSTHNTQYGARNMWRDDNSFNYYNLNMLFERFITPTYFSNSNEPFLPRRRFHPTPTLRLTSRLRSRKRAKGNSQKEHLDGIKKVTSMLKTLLQNGEMDPENIQSLQRLIRLYNNRYLTRIRISPDFDIVDENVLETIDLDEEPSEKKRRKDLHDQLFKENLKQLKQLAYKLKNFEANENSTAIHRGAIAELLKVFNESYQVEYFLNEDHEIKNPRDNTMDTSGSESDGCVKEDSSNLSKKKTLNPLNTMKTEESTASTSEDCALPVIKKYCDVLVNTFSKDWLPKEDDFGRAEVVKKNAMNYACSHDEKDLRREKFMYDFLKIQSTKSDNWLNLKISFYQSFSEAMEEFQGKMNALRQMNTNVTVKSEDNSMASVLRKLTIIKSDDVLSEECNLKIDFDVYNRNIKNFRKTSRGSPNFRLIVLEESAKVPSGQEMAKLKSKYDDDIPIIFAIVGMNSIGYIQIKPTVVPVFLPNES